MQSTCNRHAIGMQSACNQHAPPKRDAAVGRTRRPCSLHLSSHESNDRVHACECEWDEVWRRRAGRVVSGTIWHVSWVIWGHLGLWVIWCDLV